MNLADLADSLPAIPLEAGASVHAAQWPDVAFVIVAGGLVVLRSAIPGSARRTITCHAGGGSLVLGSDTRYHGPGHNSVLVAGDSDELVYHTYDALNGGTPTVQIRPLSWAPDGWPVAGPPLA